MSSEAELYQRAKAICLELLELDWSERAGRMDAACAGDPSLRSEVESLLDSFDTDTDHFLDALRVGVDEEQQSEALSAVGRALDEHLGASPRLEQAPIAGELFAERYRLKERLGAGGMGEVWSAHDEVLGEDVALKRIRRRTYGDQRSQRLEQLLAEASAARRVLHPGVCRVHDAGRVGEEVFLTMELVAGGDLRSRLDTRGPLDGSDLRSLALGLASALTAIHAGGLLHRDLKPGNVLFDLEGGLRISDFGLAAPREELGDEAHRSGTGCYMAPELHAGVAPSEASDLYAFGLVLFEAMTARRAFRSADELSGMAERGELPTLPAHRVDELDPILVRLVQRCLAINPAARPSSAAELVRILELSDPIEAAFALGEAPSARIIARADARGLLGARGAWLVFAGFAALALLATVLGGRGGRGDSGPDLAAAQAVLRELGAEDHAAFRYGAWVDANELVIDGLEPPAKPGSLSLWYRGSAQPLSPDGWLSLLVGGGRVRYSDPALDTPEVTSLLLGGDGELLGYVSAKAGSTATSEGQPDWAKTFELAGRRLADFKAAPDSTPRPLGVSSSTWRSTTTTELVRASWSGSRLDSFELLATPPSERPKPAGYLNLFLIALILAGMTPLAVRRVRTGRGDLGGALRLAAFGFLGIAIPWLLTADYPSGPVVLVVFAVGGLLVGFGGMLALLGLHLVLEPFAQRTWPHLLISWSRVLRGRWSDPLVRGHVLLGLALGAIGPAARSLSAFVLGREVGTGMDAPLPLFASLPDYLALSLGAAPGALLLSFEYLAVLILSHALLRSRRASIASTALIAAFLTSSGASTPALAALGAALALLALFVLLRFGFLTLVVQFLTTSLLLSFTGDLPATATLIAIGLLLTWLATRGPARPTAPRPAPTPAA